MSTSMVGFVTENPGNQPYVLYELKLSGLLVGISEGGDFDASFAMSNGRANYIIVQGLIAACAGLEKNSEGAKSDLRDQAGRGYEVKSFKDPQRWPSRTYKSDTFHTAASSAFSANNDGPRIKKLLKEGNYDMALKICRESGYDKNQFYVYVNSGKFDFSVPLRYLILPTEEVLRLVSKEDPRVIARKDLLELVRDKQEVLPKHTIETELRN